MKINTICSAQSLLHADIQKIPFSAEAIIKSTKPVKIEPIPSMMPGIVAVTSLFPCAISLAPYIFAESRIISQHP